MIYLAVSHINTAFVCLTLKHTDMLYQTALECSVKNFFFMSEESLNTFVFQLAYHTGSHIDNLFVKVCYVLRAYTVEYALLCLFIKETKQQIACLIV